MHCDEILQAVTYIVLRIGPPFQREETASGPLSAVGAHYYPIRVDRAR